MQEQTLINKKQFASKTQMEEKMNFKPIVAVALAGTLACSVVEARKVQQLNPTGWSGGTTIIGNMRAVTGGVGGGKHITLKPHAESIEYVGQFINTSKVSYGMIFDNSSYNALTFSNTIFTFSEILSTSSATGLYLKSNSISLGFGDPEENDMHFTRRVYGRNSVAGIVADGSNFSLTTGTINFAGNLESDGTAYGILSKNGVTAESFIQISDGENARGVSGKIKFGTIKGRDAYGIKFVDNRGKNKLDIRQNASRDQANREVGGIYFNQVRGELGDSALFVSTGNTSISVANAATLRADLVTANKGASLFTIYNGNVDIALSGRSSIYTREVSSSRETYGLNIVGNPNTAAYARIDIAGGSTFEVRKVYSSRSSVYGIKTDKALNVSMYQDGSSLSFGEISTDMSQLVPPGDAYGIRSESTTKLDVINGSRVSFSSIKGANAYGISSNYNITIKPQGNGNLTFGTIYAGGSRGTERAVGLESQKSIHIAPEIGGRVIFENISSKSEANGIRVMSGLTVDHTHDPYQSGKGSGITFKNIESHKHNALGIYTPTAGMFEFKGGGRTTFEKINYLGSGANSVYTAAGIVVDNNKTKLSITKGHELKFDNIVSYNNAYGARVSSLELSMKENGLLKFGNISANNGAIGIHTSGSIAAWINGGSQLAFGGISTQNGEAYALKFQAGGNLVFDHSTLTSNEISSSNGNAALLYSNNGSLIVSNHSSLNSQAIRAGGEASGVKTDGDLQFKVDTSSNATFSNITSSRGNAYGIKTGATATVWTRQSGNLRFSSIVGSATTSGIKANRVQASAENNSSIRFDSISSSNGMAVGIEARSFAYSSIGNGQLYFNNITSNVEANGLRIANSIIIDLRSASTSDRVVFQNIQSRNGNALGMYVYENNANIAIQGSGSNVTFKDISHFGEGINQFAGGIVSDGSNFNLMLTGHNQTWFDKVASNSQAFGIRVYSMTMSVDNGSELNFGKISGRSNAYGLYSSGGQVNISGGGVIKFSNIFSSRASKYGIYTPNSQLNIANTSLIFGAKNNNTLYGIYNNIDGLIHSIGDTSLSINGNSSVGIYGETETRINLQAGKTLKISAKNGSSETMAIDGKISLYMQNGGNSRLILDSGNGKMNRLDATSNSTISLAGIDERSHSNLQLRKLTVEKWNGSGANVVLYASGTASIGSNSSGFDGRAYQSSKTKASTGGSDRIIINGTNSSARQDNTLKVTLAGLDNTTTKYVVLAEVGGGAKDKVIFNGLTAGQQNTTIQTETGYSVGDIKIIRRDNGNKAYYIGEIPTASLFRLNTQRAGRMGETQNASASVVSANFNNLNKRMGELRENSHSHGVWARVFNGEVQSDFGSGSSSTYTTVQAGYDYNLSSDLDSNSYLGFALSYLNSKTDNILSETKGNGVEAGVYFAYVKDSGLYTDTIAKIAYMSNTNSSSNGNDLSDTSNVSFIISQEIGYQAEVVDGFYLTPQFESTYAYLGGSEMNVSSNGTTTLTSTQDAANTWRNRVGLQASYKLKNEEKQFNASFYAMGSYTYDYVSGGDLTMKDPSAQTSDTLANTTKSDGRFVLNVGSNIDIKDATRLYLDFEKSFGGKINTNYQINVGVRYSFGEKISK